MEHIIRKKSFLRTDKHEKRAVSGSFLLHGKHCHTDVYFLLLFRMTYSIVLVDALTLAHEEE